MSCCNNDIVILHQECNGQEKIGLFTENRIGRILLEFQ